MLYEVDENLSFEPLTNYEYNYSFIFFFERKYYSPKYTTNGMLWMNKNWWYSIVYSLFYVILVYTGQRLMKNREKFHLYRSLVAWNIVLAIFSIMGAVRFLPNFLTVLYNKGLEHTICVFDYNYGVTGCWAWLFILSKLVELIDTLFIVLRKQKLIFLHWYHHATVLIYCWYSTHGRTSTGRWFVAMNYTIHSLMYSYYAFRALRFNIPKYVNIIITSLQISQMVVGIGINCIAYWRKIKGDGCHVSNENIYWSFFMYFTYFVLFFHFFMNAYLNKSKKSPPPIAAMGSKPIAQNGRSHNHHHYKKNE